MYVEKGGKKGEKKDGKKGGKNIAGAMLPLCFFRKL
jgi:hypothetical protein